MTEQEKGTDNVIDLKGDHEKGQGNPSTSDNDDRDPQETERNRLIKQINDLEDQLLRTAAEAENRCRRMEEQAEKRIQYGLFQFVKELLPIADNIERALASTPQK